jgi:hypothetical protein
MSLKQRASRLELKALTQEIQTFETWIASLPREAFLAWSRQTLSRLSESGLRPPLPKGFWSCPGAEQAAYLESLKELASTEDLEVSRIIRESWRSGIQETQAKEAG